MASELASAGRSTPPPSDASRAVEEDATAAHGPFDGSPDQLPLDVVFGILSNKRRLRALRYLLEDPETSLGTLAEYVAAIENDKPEQVLTSAERKSVYVAFYQSHLPRMDDAGVIDFDSDRGTVELAANADQIVQYLVDEEDATNAVDHVRYALAMAALGVGALIAQHALYPAAWLTGFMIGSLLGMMTALAIREAAWPSLFSIGKQIRKALPRKLSLERERNGYIGERKQD